MKNLVFAKAAALTVTLLFLGVSIGTAQAQQADFARYISQFERKAVTAGITPQTYRSALVDVAYDTSIARRISGQPEFTTPVWDYLDVRVTQNRIRNGQQAFNRNSDLFIQIGQRFGVDPYVLAAIWGVETDFGAVLGNRSLIKPILPSLANLSFQRRGRVALDEAEFIGALKLLQQQNIQSSQLVGSWAGAIGHLQVNPNVLLDHGVDGNGDGVINPHTSLADALATSANLLISFGYRQGVDWGFEVNIPQGFDLTLASRNELRPVSFFAQRGVERVAGREFSDLNEPVFLYLPAGLSGPKFLLTKNYLTFKDYNFSDSYALSVAHLTDRLKGAKTFVQSWPRNTKFPNRAQRVDIQQWLKQLGFYSGDVDGRIGPISQAAFQKFQARMGQAADGFITLEAHSLLRQAVGG